MGRHPHRPTTTPVPPLPPPSLVLTRHIPTAANIFDTDEEEGSPPPPPPNVVANPANPPRVSAATTFEALPDHVVTSFGLEGGDLRLVNEILNSSCLYVAADATLRMSPPSPQMTPIKTVGRHPDLSSRIYFMCISLIPEPQMRMSTDLPLRQDFLITSVRATFLKGDLEYFTHASYTGPARFSRTPLTLVLAHIRRQFRAGIVEPTAVPPGYGHRAMRAQNRLRNYCVDIIEEEKRRFRAMGPIPDLQELMAYLWREQAPNEYQPLLPQAATLQDWVRIAHVRLHMLNYKYATPAASASCWVTLDQAIQSIAERPANYREAHAQAILMRDAELFDGNTTLRMIPEANRRLPNPAEIAARLALVERQEVRLEHPPEASEEEIDKLADDDPADSQGADPQRAELT
ncbi:hypothetical protein PGTUg99_004854 [Puccinia graminis f. sp. tritici]|uniref:Uncharacterized protein n=1 Tax=Puccinia graminis f. sp. tritici TaxID=56615 RepID=A0A5B0RI15_PUCGR|nr:hypothetical protein PGTUg99_004854 [Puccinia graminis f. sp. tritici]